MAKRGELVIRKIFLVVIILIVIPIVLAQSENEVSSQPQNTTITIDIEGVPIGAECEFIEGEPFWTLGGSGTSAQDNCLSEGETCCAIGFICDIDTNTCVSDDVVPTSCEKFITPDSCNLPISDEIRSQEIEEAIYQRVGDDLLENGIDPLDIINSDFCMEGNSFEFQELGQCTTIVGPCKCKWVVDITVENGGTCIDKFSVDIDNDCDNINDPGDSFGLTCETTTNELEDLCFDQGVFRLTWTSVLVDLNNVIRNDLETSSCQSGSEVYACPSSDIKLPFFGFFNLVISIIGITLIYYVFYIRRKGK